MFSIFVFLLEIDFIFVSFLLDSLVLFSSSVIFSSIFPFLSCIHMVGAVQSFRFLCLLVHSVQRTASIYYVRGERTYFFVNEMQMCFSYDAF